MTKKVNRCRNDEKEEKMKVKFKWGLTGYSGTVDGAIYYYNDRIKQCLMRKYKYPELNENNERTTSIMANLKLIEPSQGYRYNLMDYVGAYNDSKDYGHKPMNAWNNAWLKLMFAMQKALPGQVDLKTISRQQIIDEGLPCKTVKDAIEAGLLPQLPDYERWNSLI
jgi:hypothetical protein